MGARVPKAVGCLVASFNDSGFVMPVPFRIIIHPGHFRSHFGSSKCSFSFVHTKKRAPFIPTTRELTSFAAMGTVDERIEGDPCQRHSVLVESAMRTLSAIDVAMESEADCLAMLGTITEEVSKFQLDNLRLLLAPYYKNDPPRRVQQLKQPEIHSPVMPAEEEPAAKRRKKEAGASSSTKEAKEATSAGKKLKIIPLPGDEDHAHHRDAERQRQLPTTPKAKPPKSKSPDATATAAKSKLPAGLAKVKEKVREKTSHALNFRTCLEVYLG